MDNRNKGTDSGLRFVNPPGLYDPAPNGYSHLSLFPRGWRIIFPAGQGGETADQVLSEDFATQLMQAVRNTEIVLAAAGAKLSDVAKFTLYVVDYNKEKFRIIREEFARVWGDRKPAWTLTPVPALALEGMLVEIDVIAVVPEGSVRKFLDAPLDFIARLAALLPKPRVYLTRFHGIFAPNSPHRVTITPAKRGKGASGIAHIEDVESDERTPMEYLFILPILADDRDLVVIPEVIGKEESFHRDFAVNANRAAT